MGEYAEMMLDGTCCSSCGVFLGGNDGYPVQCCSCGGPGNEDWKPSRKMGKATKRLLLEMIKAGKPIEIFEVSGQIHALRNRGYAERCKRPNYWQLTAAGRAKAAELTAMSATASAHTVKVDKP